MLSGQFYRIRHQKTPPHPPEDNDTAYKTQNNQKVILYILYTNSIPKQGKKNYKKC